jgi:pimeloyl-ACP methyl ester carboxylesterase
MLKLILMPGMDGTGELFAPFVAAAENSIDTQIVRYPVDEQLGYAELLPRVRDELPVAEPFVLLGESFSGPLALLLAAQRPAGLCGVILCASFVRNPIGWFPKAARLLVRPLLFRATPRALHYQALLGRYATPELRALVTKANSLVHPAVMAARARAILAVDVRAEFRECPVPILYLRGERDRVVRKPVSCAMLRERPSLQVVKLPAPHLVLQVAPREALTAIREFLAATTRGSPVTGREHSG